MTYTFEGMKKAEGNRFFVEIPFNVWEVTGLKGNIPVRAAVDDFVFECKLTPKGNGIYYIPVKKAIADKLNETFDVSFEVIQSLSRINRDSPYSKEHPVRLIDSINEMKIVPGYCGQCCVSMLAGVPLEDVLRLMGKTECSWSKIMEALDYYGIRYAEKWFTRRGEQFACQLAALLILMVNSSSGIKEDIMARHLQRLPELSVIWRYLKENSELMYVTHEKDKMPAGVLLGQQPCFYAPFGATTASKTNPNLLPIGDGFGFLVSIVR